MAAPPMLSLKEGSDTKKMTANLLPCRVHHDGSIDPVGAYWMPTDSTDDSKEAYFRGRKLKGKTLPLPEGYRGVVAERNADELKREAKLPEDDEEDNEEDDVVAMETVGAMRITGEFDEMVIWSHEALATAAADPYVRSVEEWLQSNFIHICEDVKLTSMQIHSFEDETSDKTE
ncbi:hypothetical protein LLEC1_07614 [Akanthomyces lecanii]|uniref:Uncharacterized protein n=1 Tax=Cordyceps confragosa TaxID=2714763 RepID=A0A179IHP5_CORDF|nr:hypothetical protein LLEC1_07614 [Akanthomyces lecanii]